MPLQFHLALLVLAAAAIHATWNAVLKASGERFLTFAVVAATGTGLGILAAPFVDLPEAATWPFLIASTLIHNGYFVFLILAYRHGDLSQVYPLVRGTAPLAVTVLAMFFRRRSAEFHRPGRHHPGVAGHHQPHVRRRTATERRPDTDPPGPRHGALHRRLHGGRRPWHAPRRYAMGLHRLAQYP